MEDVLRQQYETYPYPAREPADEDQRLIAGSPSHLDEINHYVFGGRLDFRRPLRILVAGGGTGDGTIMLAQHLADAGNPGRIAYLDLSAAAGAVAAARAARRGLSNIDFFRGSLLALGESQVDGLPEGLFDYIDCCGVLHHLPDPAAGLQALTRVLAPGGGIGLMVYAPLGRTGVYPLQQALAALTRAMPEPAARVAAARRLLRQLPPSNWFTLNRYLNDHHQSDAGLYDLLLHSCDRPFSVADLETLATAAGLAITVLIEPARYEPRYLVNDPRILKLLDGLSWLERAAWAEQVSGAITKHIAYLVRPGQLAQAVAVPDRPTVVPVLRDLDGGLLGRTLPPGGSLSVELHGTKQTVPLPRLAGPILGRIDGRASLADIQTALAAAGAAPDWGGFKTQFDQLYEALNPFNKMLLRCP